MTLPRPWTIPIRRASPVVSAQSLTPESAVGSAETMPTAIRASAASSPFSPRRSRRKALVQLPITTSVSTGWRACPSQVPESVSFSRPGFTRFQYAFETGAAILSSALTFPIRFTRSRGRSSMGPPPGRVASGAGRTRYSHPGVGVPLPPRQRQRKGVAGPLYNGSVGTDRLVIHGAREHNLKNVTLDLPRDQLIVFTGISGSGKSSLAFDTIYAEGQRRYVESLSSYARQFLGQMDKPDVDFIEGLSPAISIDQKSASRNPRSTVGTITEIYDYLRLLYARVGVPHCPD